MIAKRRTKTRKPRQDDTLTDEDRAQAAAGAREWLKQPAGSYQIKQAAKYRRMLVDTFLWPTGSLELNHTEYSKEVQRCELRQLADKLSPNDLTAVVKLAEVLGKVKPDAELGKYIEDYSQMLQQRAAAYFRKEASDRAKRGWKARKHAQVQQVPA